MKKQKKRPYLEVRKVIDFTPKQIIQPRVVKVEITGVDAPLKEVMERLKWFNERGYEAFLEGCGNGDVKIHLEKPKLKVVKY